MTVVAFKTLAFLRSPKKTNTHSHSNTLTHTHTHTAGAQFVCPVITFQNVWLINADVFSSGDL